MKRSEILLGIVKLTSLVGKVSERQLLCDIFNGLLARAGDAEVFKLLLRPVD